MTKEDDTQHRPASFTASIQTTEALIRRAHQRVVVSRHMIHDSHQQLAETRKKCEQTREAIRVMRKWFNQ